MLLSIITPCLNQVSFVREAAESVLAQDYTPVEHIIVDGGSTDGTLDVVSEFEGIKLISELDRGVYDALNKGIKAAKGDVIGFLNADDLYVPGVFQEVMSYFQRYPHLNTVCGGAEIFGHSKNGEARKRIFQSPFYSSLSVRNICHGQPLLNARFFKKEVFDEVGFFDWRYRIGSDREFLIRMALKGIRSEHIPKCLYRYRSHPGSLTFDPSGGHAWQANQEYWLIAESFLKGSLPSRDRFWIQLWHARVSTEMVLRSLRKRELNLTLLAARRGFKASPWWPAFIGIRLARRLKTALRGQAI